MPSDKHYMEYADQLLNYSEAVATIHLLKEVVDSESGAVVSIGTAQKMVALENDKDNPSISDIFQKILQRSGKPGSDEALWKQDDNGQWVLEAVIAIGGAIYETRITDKGDETPGQYDLEIQSKLDDDAQVERGKLFFNPGYKARVRLTTDAHGTIHAVTESGLSLSAESFFPYSYQNETIMKFAASMKKGDCQRLAIMGTGSGKSIIMSGVAQAVGRCVMIVPNDELAAQQTKEVQQLIGRGEVHGKQTTPRVFTLNQLGDLFNLKDTSEDNISAIQRYFSQVLSGTSTPIYDQVILAANHPLFSVLIPEIQHTMVLVDESHEHTFTKKSLQNIQQIIENNAVLALTGTPTSKLYQLFPGDPVDDLSLAAAIRLGKVRPIKPEVSYHAGTDLVHQAILHYFNDYYLPGQVKGYTKHINGYTDPVSLQQDIIKRLQQEHPELEQADIEKIAKEEAIEMALNANRIRCQRNMSFADDPTLREQLSKSYMQIRQGSMDRKTLKRYERSIAKFRRQSEIDARVDLLLEFERPEDRSRLKNEFRREIAQSVPLPKVDLVQDILNAQQKDIQRSINSFALHLVLGEKPEKFAEADRTHKLAGQMESYDDILANKPGTNADRSRLDRLAQCKAILPTDRDKLRQQLESIPGCPICQLPAEHRERLTQLIIDRALQIAEQARQGGPIANIVIAPEPLDIDGMHIADAYSVCLDETSDPKKRAESLAMVEVGLQSHLIADHSLATGISIKDVLNVQLLHKHVKRLNPNPQNLNGSISIAQGAARCVRHPDIEGRAQQFIDVAYKGKGLIATVQEVIHPESEKKLREVTMKRAMGESHQRRVSIDTLRNPEFRDTNYQILQLRTLLEDKKTQLIESTQQIEHMKQESLGQQPHEKRGHHHPLSQQWSDTIHSLEQSKTALSEEIKDIETQLELLRAQIKGVVTQQYEAHLEDYLAPDPAFERFITTDYEEKLTDLVRDDWEAFQDTEGGPDGSADQASPLPKQNPPPSPNLSGSRMTLFHRSSSDMDQQKVHLLNQLNQLKASVQEKRSRLTNNQDKLRAIRLELLQQEIHDPNTLPRSLRNNKKLVTQCHQAKMLTALIPQMEKQCQVLEHQVKALNRQLTSLEREIEVQKKISGTSPTKK